MTRIFQIKEPRYLQLKQYEVSLIEQLFLKNEHFSIVTDWHKHHFDDNHDL